jgi:hypothetical protein
MRIIARRNSNSSGRSLLRLEAQQQLPLIAMPRELVDQRLEEGNQMKFAFKRRPALRSVLAAGVIAASFIIQPAVAQPPAPLSKSCSQRLSALYREYAAKYREHVPYLNSIEGQYRKLCEYGRKTGHPKYLQQLAALNKMRRAGCWDKLQETTYSKLVRMEKSHRDIVENDCRKAAAQERQQGRSR